MSRGPLIAFVIIPTGLNCLVGYAAFFLWPRSFTASQAHCYQVVLLVLVPAAVSLIAFCIHEIDKGVTLAALIGHAVALIFVFAGMYRGFGLAGQDPVLDETTGLYFSVVTWTTLGYGDLQPAHGLRLIAALEALLGYVFLGLIVGIGTNVIGGQKGQPKQQGAGTPRQ